MNALSRHTSALLLLLTLAAAGCNSNQGGAGKPGAGGGADGGNKVQLVADGGGSYSMRDLKKIHTKSGLEMVLIPAGEFSMGDQSGDDDEKPDRQLLHGHHRGHAEGF
jgi:hypothetical protein